MPIRVRFEPLEGTPLDKLVTMDYTEEYNLPAGVEMGYYCKECGQQDESLGQVGHKEFCSMKATYDYEVQVETGPHIFRALIRSTQEFVFVVAGESHHPDCEYEFTKRVGEKVSVWCPTCENSDDSLDELEHDECCRMARHNLGLNVGGRATGRIAPDGGCPSDH